MNPNNNKNEEDVVGSRQEYLDNLALEASLNETIEQAVMNYKKTGILPPITQMADTRTPTQKLADLELLKQNIIKDLEPIADPIFASRIVSRIMQSPLNINNSLLIFTAQRIENIVKELQKIYKYGIEGNENDAEQFVQFIYKYYTDKNNLALNTKKFMSRLGTNNSSSMNGRINSIHQKIKTVGSHLLSFIAELNKILQDYLSRPEHREEKQIFDEIKINVSDMIDIMKDLLFIYPAQAGIYDNLESILLKYQGTDEYYELRYYISILLDFVNNHIPNFDYANSYLTKIQKIQKTMIQNIEDGIDLKTDFLSLISEVRSMNEHLFSEIKDKKKKDLLKEAKEAMGVLITKETETGEIINTPAEVPSEFLPPNNMRPLGFNNTDWLLNSPQTIEQANLARQIQEGNIEPPREGENEDEIRKKLRERFYRLYDYGIQKYIEKYHKTPEYERSLTILRKKSQEFEEAQTISQKLNVYTKLKDLLNVLDIHPLAGMGISQQEKIEEKKTRGRPKGCGLNGLESSMKQKFLKKIDTDKGIKPNPRYVNFGKLVIDNKKLLDNIVSIRRTTGACIPKNPQMKVSDNLCYIFKKMVGGGSPTYDELQKLTATEKEYLHKISKMSDIVDKFNIPTPPKDEEEKDMHKFNVLKGEIMSGNDSKQAIKEFKLLLVKLSKNNSLPKKQVMDILEELAVLGY